MSAPPVQPIVIWFGRVGDMILLSALLDILHRRYGRGCHLIGAGSWVAQLYATHEAVARVSCLHRYTAFLFDVAWWRTLAALRASRADPVYVCEYDARKLARVQRLLTLSGTSPARCLFITREMSFAPAHRGDTSRVLGDAPPQAQLVAPAHWGDAPARLAEAPPPTLVQAPAHWVDRLISFGRLTPAAFGAADYPWPSPPPRCAPYLEVSAAAQADCAQWIEAQGWSARPLVLVQPGNRRTMRGRRLRLAAEDDKAWPIDRWAALLHRLHAHMPEAVIVLCGAPRESLLLKWIMDAARLPAVAAAELPLGRLLALCARAHSMISVDTGPAHAAAALSLPLVVMFGANSPAEWLPRSAGGSAVVGVGGPPQSRRLDQVPMESVFAAWCGLPGRPAPVAAGGGAAADGAPRALRPTAARATAP
ncbi:MAG TPA: glycosyltransferase family 9 protein [Steroidobacteraceae bacterium]|nr:glycosyltransferase family 9 protein [Steroidobacteraceae bacterium]